MHGAATGSEAFLEGERGLRGRECVVEGRNTTAELSGSRSAHFWYAALLEQVGSSQDDGADARSVGNGPAVVVRYANRHPSGTTRKETNSRRKEHWTTGVPGSRTQEEGEH